MKTIVMIRHAKAEASYDDDFKRSLQKKGALDAEHLSLKLSSLGIIPQRIIASTANRAWETASIYAKNLSFEVLNIEAWPAFYDGVTTYDFLAKIAETSNQIDCIFVVGHNPTIHYLVHNLCSDFNKDTPTCATAVIQFDVEYWKDIEARTGKLELHLTPQPNF